MSYSSFILATALMAVVLIVYSWQIKRRAGPFVATGVFQIAYIWYYFIIIGIGHVYFQYLPFAERPYDIPEIFTNLMILSAVGMIFANLGFALVRQVRLPALDYDRRRLMMASGALIVVGVIAWIFSLDPGMLYLDEKLLRDADIPITLYIFSGATPLMVVMFSVAYFRGRQATEAQKWILLCVLVVMSVLFGGLRGTRSAMIIVVSAGMIWIHFQIRPFRLREIVAMGLFGFVFLVAYGRYKFGGLGAIFGTDAKGVAYANRMLDPLRIFLLDFGRTEVQAVILDNFRQGYFIPRYNGETYIRAFTQILPQSWEPEWFRPKTVVGALAQLTPDRPGAGLLSSRIYGLTGEAILNFGYLAIPVVFFIFGLVHAWLLAALDKMKGAWTFLIPLAIILPVFILFADLDNIVVFIIVYWALPVLVLAVSLRWAASPRDAGAAGNVAGQQFG